MRCHGGRARIVWGFPPSIPIVFEESGRDDERERMELDA